MNERRDFRRASHVITAVEHDPGSETMHQPANDPVDDERRRAAAVGNEKLIPEWGLDADRQVLAAGLLVLTILLGAWGVQRWRSGDDPTDIAADAAANPGAALEVDRNGGLAAASAGAVALDGDDETTSPSTAAPSTSTPTTEAIAAPTTTAPSTTTTEATTTTAAPIAAAATVTASPDGIVLDGTVDSEATADDLRAAAAAGYAPELIDDRLAVLDGADSFALTIAGAAASQADADALSAALAGVGADETSGTIEVDAASATAEALNDLVALEPILFQSGTAVILDESAPTLEAVAAILLDAPDFVVEIEGHTDSRGGAEANLALSQARADAVLEALRGRGVANELTAVGYGETRLAVDPDDTPEAQQANRRIEFVVR